VTGMGDDGSAGTARSWWWYLCRNMNHRRS
jgi:hypothetical protein